MYGHKRIIKSFFLYRAGTTARNVSKKTASMCTPSRGHIISRFQHTTTTPRPLGVEPNSPKVSTVHYHFGRLVPIVCCHSPSRGLLRTEVATYILQPVDWLLRSAETRVFVCRFSTLSHGQLSSLKTRVYCYTSMYAHFCIGTAVTPREVSVLQQRVIPAKRWDQGTSASPLLH